MAARITENNLSVAILTGSCLLLAALVLLGYLFKSGRFSLSILAGGMIVLANSYWLRRIVKRALSLEPQRASRYAQIRYLIRLGITGLILYALIVLAGADIIGLLLGLSVNAAVITALSFYMFVTKGE